MSIRVKNEILYPLTATIDEANEFISLWYPKNVKADIKFTPEESHLTFELASITKPESIDLVIWGPYPTNISKIIGETIGVVRGETYALGIQALNPKTLGGYPWNENDCMPQIDILEQKDFGDLSESGKRHVLYRVEAAKPTEFGSTLQAFCRNRNKLRIIKNLQHEQYTAIPYEDGGIVGSKIALFGCPVKDALDTIGSIEQTEGLPHPVVDGSWGKKTVSATAAYIILEFGIDNIDEALGVTKKAGLKYLYHPDPFENWGHFNLKTKFFPEGINSLRDCVKKAERDGIMLGVHTLSNFITINDPYVTPVPDDRLAKVGATSITSDIDEKDKEILIHSPDFFSQYQNNHLKTALVGKELIRYEKVSERAPWKLLNCQRGAFGTIKKKHKQGAPISKLTDHAYKVFLSNPRLSLEISGNLAKLFNTTGLRQISFDGLEGNQATGLGNYGEILFTLTWFNNLSDEIKSHFIADASRTSHFFWHIYTRMNWGEPWYADFRESQTQYRIKNQDYFKRNFMPAMLGWFKMTPETSIEDIEWMLARSAGFDAGYAFVTSLDTLKKNQSSDKILNLLAQWEKIRMLNLFSPEQKKKMKDIKNEFTLKTISSNEWNLHRVISYKFKHEKRIRQPGEPSASTFTINNPYWEQNLNIIVTAAQGDLKDIKIDIDRFKNLVVPIDLATGESFKYMGGKIATIYDSNWQEIKRVKIDSNFFKISKGDHTIGLDFGTMSGEKPEAKVEFRVFSPPEKIIQI
jgi:hypothetical protein